MLKHEPDLFVVEFYKTKFSNIFPNITKISLELFDSPIWEYKITLLLKIKSHDLYLPFFFNKEDFQTKNSNKIIKDIKSNYLDSKIHFLEVLDKKYSGHTHIDKYYTFIKHQIINKIIFERGYTFELDYTVVNQISTDLTIKYNNDILVLKHIQEASMLDTYTTTLKNQLKLIYS